MNFLYIIVIASLAFYFFLRRVYTYWKRNGFPEVTPSIPFGNMTSFMKQETSFSINLCNLYWESTEPVLGIYQFFKPALMIRDALLAKRIMTTDFEFFHDRGLFYQPDRDAMTAHLFSTPGKAWKDLRVTITPLFTSGKLRSMFSILLNVGNQLANHIDTGLENGQTVFEMKDLMSRFVLNSIASILWGLDIDTIKEPEHPFRQISHVMNPKDYINKIRGSLKVLCPQWVLQLFWFSCDKIDQVVHFSLLLFLD